MISITSINYSTRNELIIDNLPNSKIDEGNRRANRSSTLDGGSVVNDFGFSHSDRQFIIKFNPTKAQHDLAIDFIQNDNLIYISLADGFYEAVPFKYSLFKNEMTLTILPLRKLN